MNTLSRPLFGLWRSHELAQLIASNRAGLSPGYSNSVQAAVRAALSALPDMQIDSVLFPGNKLSTSHHYLIWMRGKAPVTSRLFTPVLVDVATGQLTTAKGLPWYLRTLEVSRPLHFGDYGGMPLKIIWAIFDVALIVVLLSGSYLWLSRRKTPVEAELDRLVKVE